MFPVPVGDVVLVVEDSGGPGVPVVYLNGGFADRTHWEPVVQQLGVKGWRHIRFDARGRGESGVSGDYSFAACLRDLDAVLSATGVGSPVLVGWSYGATLAVQWAASHPDRVAGVVAVDGALPYGLTGTEGQERIRRTFHRMRWLFPIARRFGLAAKMSATEHAEINIELNAVNAALAPTLQQVGCPMRFVLATGKSLGGGEREMEAARAALDPVLASNPHLQVSAKVQANHSRILRREPAAVAAAVREVAPARGPMTR